MDNRTKEILEDFNSRSLDLDDKFRFHCTMCGSCCVEREDILLNPLDIFKLAKELKMSCFDVIKTYCESYLGKTSRMIVVRLLPVGPKHICPLLNQNKCSVHKNKPTVCALFPLGRGLRFDKDNPDYSNATIQYFLQDIRCGDSSEEHTVRDWVEGFNLAEQEQFFPIWTEFVMRCREFMLQLESMVSEELATTYASAVFSAVYVCYEPDKEFLPQFKSNRDKLLESFSQIGLLFEAYKSLSPE